MATDPRLPAHQPVALILVGCVVEQPLSVLLNARRFLLIYGEDDAIVYHSSEGQDSSLLKPSEYGVWSAANLLLRKWQDCDIEVWSGCGHLLVSGDKIQREDVVDSLAETICSSMEG
jgi:hypothetical protein